MKPALAGLFLLAIGVGAFWLLSGRGRDDMDNDTYQHLMRREVDKAFAHQPKAPVRDADRD